MDIFEYISVAVSIVLALGIGKLLSAVTAVFSPTKRDWLHITWFFAILLMALLHWVAVWDLNAAASWNVAQFLALMATPMLLYVATHLLVSSSPDSIENWGTHFSSVSRPLVATMALILASFWIRMYAILGENVVQPLGIAIFVANLAAVIFPSRILLMVIVAIWYVGMFTQIQTNFEFDQPTPNNSLQRTH